MDVPADLDIQVMSDGTFPASSLNAYYSINLTDIYRHI